MEQLALPLGTRPHYLWNQLPWYPKYEKVRPHNCSECGSVVMDYYRALATSMAVGLLRLYKLHQAYPDERSFHVKQFDKQNARGEFGVLSKWMLVEEEVNRDTKKKTSGRWRLTPFGRLFVEREAEVPKYVILGARSSLKGYAGDLVDIKKCLEHKNRFSYPDLMKRSLERMI